MTRADALRDLLAKVEAGKFPIGRGADLWGDKFGPTPLDVHWGKAWDAFNGSLDAAKALHEAVLPGWDWGRSAASGQFYVWNTGEGPASAMSNNEDPARAWLICILKALIAAEDN